MKDLGFFILWMLSSIIIPFGVVGDLIYRHEMDIPLSKKPGTYFLSLLPIIGPLIAHSLLGY
jgi:hypothetical protein